MTKIQTAKFIAIANKLGLNVVEQPSQYKITGEDPNKRFYIPGTKTVHKVELSGWTSDLAVAWEEIYPGKKAPSGKITQVVDFRVEEKEVLKNFFKLAKGLAKKAKVEKPAPTEAPTEAPASSPEASEPVLLAADSQ